jgi:hypothetical protein
VSIHYYPKKTLFKGLIQVGGIRRRLNMESWPVFSLRRTWKRALKLII